MCSHIFIYTSNEEDALLAVASDEYRDNHRETREVCFLWFDEHRHNQSYHAKRITQWNYLTMNRL